MGLRRLTCATCGCSSDEHARGWAGFLAEDLDGIGSLEERPDSHLRWAKPTMVVCSCPDCAAVEFGYVRGEDEKSV